ncbi:MAG: hypothetical protein K2O16_01470 [Lachnospiraceae bacterium]|nr:hypothetical protein [Lachnospiraceae bacterium]
MATDEEFLDGLMENEGEGGTSGEGASAAEGTSVSDDWLTHIDDLFAQADEQANENSSSSGGEENNESLDMFDENISFLNADFELADFENMDVTQIIDSMEKAGSDLEEINGLLKDVDQNISVADSVPSAGDVSLQDSAPSSDNAPASSETSSDSVASSDDSLALELAKSVENSNVTSDDIFDIFAESAPEEGADSGTSEEKSEAEEKSKKEKPPKKKKSKLFGKGKKSGEETDTAVADVELLQNTAGTDELLDQLPGAEQEEDKKNREKKPGLFTRMMTYLTEEEEEPVSDENAAILKELDEEDKQKSKKKKKEKKKGKKDKKGKKGQEGDASAEGEEGAEEEQKPKKEKKKKEKKEKKPKEESTEKPVKALSRKNMLLIIAFCATLTTCLITLSTFLPEYSDRKNARDAFYAGDYETAYALLYNKRLDSNDTVIFNRVKIVLKFEKRLKSYENNMALGRELEAVHALMQGVADYQNPEGADEYGARGEIDAIYQQICSILEEKYGITPEQAIEINAYENIEYTKKLDSVVNGTDYTAPGEEKEEEPVVPQDILPDEEEIIIY